MGREPEALGRGPMGAVHRLCLKVLSLCRSPATGPGALPLPLWVSSVSWDKGADPQGVARIK